MASINDGNHHKQEKENEIRESLNAAIIEGPAHREEETRKKVHIIHGEENTATIMLSEMRVAAEICSEESTQEGSAGAVGGGAEAVCMTRRTMDPRPELLCSSRGLKRCHQIVAFCLGWSPSTEISDG